MKDPVALIHDTDAGPWPMANFACHFPERGWPCRAPAYRHHAPPGKAHDRRGLRGLLDEPCGPKRPAATSSCSALAASGMARRLGPGTDYSAVRHGPAGPAFADSSV